MPYSIYLGKTLLPVTPGKINIKINNANKTYTLMNEGEINVLKDPKLTDIEFDCMLPNVKYPFATYKNGFKKASEFLEVFEDLKVSKKSFQFIYIRTMPNGSLIAENNITVSMESYTIKEEEKEGFDMIVSVKLKQYKNYETKTAVISSDNETAKIEEKREATITMTSKEPYIVQSGDSLWNIAKKIYGDGLKYTMIYEANKSIIGGNPNLIYAGQELTIPAI